LELNWYLIVKFFHILAVTTMVGGMFARQLVRGIARRSDDVNTIASLTRAAICIDRAMVIPWSNVLFVAGIILAIMAGWPLFGFLQGAAQNWLLVSNILLILMMVLVIVVFLPHNKKVEGLLQAALANGKDTPELTAALNDRKNALAHHAEEIIIVLITLLMVLKPF
jgi:uncharacterized membrane protein